MANSPSHPFDNKGIYQRTDPAKLAPGEQYFIENVTSQQDGSLTTRTGHNQLSPVGLTAPIHTISKLNLGGADASNPRYLGSGTLINRTSAGYVASAVYSGLGFGVRWGSIQYNAGTSGTPALYIATQGQAATFGNAALRDNGSYTTLQKWGVDPPPIPVQANLQVPFVASLGAFYQSGFDYRFVPNGQTVHNSNAVGQKVISSITGSPGYTTITPSAADPTLGVNGVYAGMLLTFTDTGTVNTVSTGGGGTATWATGTTFSSGWAGLNITINGVVFAISAVTDSTHLSVSSITAGTVSTVNAGGGGTITGVGTQFSAGMVGMTITITSVVYTISAFTDSTHISVSTNPGTQGPGVSYAIKPGTQSGLAFSIVSETVVVLSVDSSNFYAITTFLHSTSSLVSGTQNYDDATHNDAYSGSPTASPWYQSFTGLSINAAFDGTAANGYETDDPFHIGLRCTDVVGVTNIQIQIVPNFTSTHPTYPTNYYYTNIVPAAVMSSSAVYTNPAWVELNIPKNTFLLAGSAGSGAWTWQNINQVIVIVTSTNSSASVGISNMYFGGGGGALNSASAGTTNYDWLYIYRNPTTQAVGNPCPFMITPNLTPPINNGKVTLTLTGTALTTSVANGISEISGPGSIKIYRRGGTFSDGLFRHIGYAINPGGGATVTFVDNASDQSLDQADTLEFDNDPPVPSTLPVTLTASILHFQPSGGGTDYATSSQAIGGSSSAVTTNATVRLILSNLPTNFPAANIANTIVVGSTVDIGFGPTAETCIIQLIGYGTSGSDSGVAWFEVWLQYNHNVTATDNSETIECDTTLRGRCDLVHEDFDCIFLAGDTNNPATLYQSKVGRPEAFPVVNLENNFAQQINVGSPSNPINGITSIGPGELVCMNLDNLFIVQVWSGQMLQPVLAPASRGLYSKWCWCKGDNRIWYLAYDGIYTWAGGESQKISEQIDYMFKNQVVNGITPVDMTKALQFSFAYAENSLYIGFIDQNANYRRLRYEALYNRWTIESIYATAIGPTTNQINALFLEPDTGNFLVSITDQSAMSWLWFCDFFSQTDGWKVSITDGTPIQYTIWRYWPIGDAGADFQVGEIVLEMQNPSDAVTANLFYNYGVGIANSIPIAAGSVANRNRYFASVNSSVTPVQYSIGLQLTGSTGSAGLVRFYSFSWRDFAWSDLGYPGPKTFGWLDMQVNTNGVSVPFQLQLDGVDVYDFNASGTFFNRASVITLPSNLTGTQFRVVPLTGYVGTDLQIYGVQPKFERLPMPLTHWDSLMQIFGSAGWKFIFQSWVDFQCAVPIIMSIYRDGNVLFLQQTIPANVNRAVSRFYLPPVNTPSLGSPALNKSQGYRFMIDSQDGLTPFQLYRDGSRVEVRNLSTDQRQGFDQKVIWTLMPLES